MSKLAEKSIRFLPKLVSSRRTPGPHASFSSKANDWFFNGQVPNHALFSFCPFFFSKEEQRVLLKASLKKLDAMDSHRARRRRKSYTNGLQASRAELLTIDPITSLFLPDELYEFVQGHFDGVIKNFRETHLTAWPEEDHTTLLPILTRLSALIPEVETQTHLLHLSSSGEILPHVDNVDASGSWILGVSLGSPRIMRIENIENDADVFEVLLPSGSVYIQRNMLRYKYKHSILKDRAFRDGVVTGGQRISIMIRDCVGQAS